MIGMDTLHGVYALAHVSIQCNPALTYLGSLFISPSQIDPLSLDYDTLSSYSPYLVIFLEVLHRVLNPRADNKRI